MANVLEIEKKIIEQLKLTSDQPGWDCITIEEADTHLIMLDHFNFGFVENDIATIEMALYADIEEIESGDGPSQTVFVEIHINDIDASIKNINDAKIELQRYTYKK